MTYGDWCLGGKDRAEESEIRRKRPKEKILPRSARSPVPAISKYRMRIGGNSVERKERPYEKERSREGKQGVIKKDQHHKSGSDLAERAITLKRSPSRPLGFRRIGPSHLPKGKGQKKGGQKGWRTGQKEGVRSSSRREVIRGRTMVRETTSSFRAKTRGEVRGGKKTLDAKPWVVKRRRDSLDSRTLGRQPTRGTKMTPAHERSVSSNKFPPTSYF